MLALSLILIALECARLWWARFSRSWRWKRLRRRAAEGEREAEILLRRAGYRIVARQVAATLHYRIDGRAEEIAVRADMLVSRRGRTEVVEVKTGRVAPQPTLTATRRQLLEYAHAFDVDSLLLVDPDAHTVTRVGLPRRRARGSRWWFALALLLLAAAIVSNRSLIAQPEWCSLTRLWSAARMFISHRL